MQTLPQTHYPQHSRTIGALSILNQSVTQRFYWFVRSSYGRNIAERMLSGDLTPQEIDQVNWFVNWLHQEGGVA